VRIRILLRKKKPVGKEAKSTVYWDRIRILPKINHFEGSVETGMNRSSHPNHENHYTTKFQEDPPHQGLSEARRGSAVFAIYLPTLIGGGVHRK
jgi:hypothetical protein